MNKKHLSSKCLSYVAVAALLAVFRGGYAQSSIEPLGLDITASNGAKASCLLGTVSKSIVSVNGLATPSPLSPIVSMRLEGVYSGVSEAETADLQVWPNPADDNLFVKSVSPVKSFIVADMSGRTVLSGASGVEDSFSIPVSSLSPGNYVLKISTVEGNSYNGKFIKK